MIVGGGIVGIGLVAVLLWRKCGDDIVRHGVLDSVEEEQEDESA
jgi:hypothetical protein